MPVPSLNQLDERFQHLSCAIDVNFRMRLRRALSWMHAAQTYRQDIDIAFIALWIAFNACYAAGGADKHTKTRNVYEHFFRKLAQYDTDKCLWRSVCCGQREAVLGLIKSKYSFSPYWNAKKDHSIEWGSRLEKTQEFVMQSLQTEDLEAMLSVVFDRLYVIRNQIMHGGAAHGIDYNRKMLTAGYQVLEAMMPIIVAIMMTRPDVDWGEVYFPIDEQCDYGRLLAPSVT